MEYDLEVRATVTPATVTALHSRARGRLMLFTPRLTPAVMDACRHLGVSCADADGNVYLCSTGSHHGTAMKQGGTALIWGASGGLGGYATQYALNGGATPICVVSSPEKADICRAMGAELIIDRSAEDYEFWKDGEQQPSEWKRLGAKIRELTGGEDVDIVYEHPGRDTFGASVYVTKRGGTIVTCASTTGYLHEYDNRYLWMTLKRIIGSHFANYRESWEANRLIAKGAIHPTLSRAYSLEDTGQAAYDVHRNLHQGKVGVLCLAPDEGLGVRDTELRAKHLDRINRFRAL